MKKSLDYITAEIRCHGNWPNGTCILKTNAVTPLTRFTALYMTLALMGGITQSCCLSVCLSGCLTSWGRMSRTGTENLVEISLLSHVKYTQFSCRRVVVKFSNRRRIITEKEPPFMRHSSFVSNCITIKYYLNTVTCI